MCFVLVFLFHFFHKFWHPVLLFFQQYLVQIFQQHLLQYLKCLYNLLYYYHLQQEKQMKKLIPIWPKQFLWYLLKHNYMHLFYIELSLCQQLLYFQVEEQVQGLYIEVEIYLLNLHSIQKRQQHLNFWLIYHLQLLQQKSDQLESYLFQFEILYLLQNLISPHYNQKLLFLDFFLGGMGF